MSIRGKIAVAGANGYVGRALCAELEKKTGISLSRVTRENCAVMQAGEYDVLVNAAMPAKRFRAKNDPAGDFRETVQKTADFFYNWKFKKFVQVSSVSARCELDTVYGRHKAAAERICDDGQSLIFRLGAMFSDDLPTGVLIDILKGNKVYVGGETRFCFASRDFAAGWMAAHMDLTGIVEVGARNTVSLAEVARRAGRRIEFDGPVQLQEIVSPRPEFPDAAEVFGFMEVMKERYAG